MADVLRVDSQQVGRASVLQLIESHALTGRMVVELAGTEAGWIDFVDGRPVGAGRGATEGVDALYDLLTIDAGITRFRSFEPGREPTVTQSLGDVLSLVMEGCRLRDEYVRLSLVVPAPPPEGLDVNDEVRTVLGSFDGRRTVADALALSNASPSRVIDVLRKLFESGHMEPSTDPRSEASMSGMATPLDFHEALESGRRHFRAGNLERAELDLLAALGFRPEDRIALQNLRRVREVRARQWIERIPHP